MKFNVIMSDIVYDEINTLMNNIDDINKGKEIGAWLFGEWEINGDECCLFIDDYVIPEQEVSKTEVDISPESMTSTIKELGFEKCNKIIGHWHIHPFGKGSTNWSCTDEEKIKDFMSPDKQREIFAFLLSSEDEIKARIEINLKGKVSFIDKEINIRKSFDNLDVNRETSEDNTKIIEKLKERVKSKVKETSLITTNFKSNNFKNEPYSKVSLFKIKKKKNRIKLNLDCLFADFIVSCDIASHSLLSFDEEIVNDDNNTYTWIYKFDKSSNLDNIKEDLIEELIRLQDIMDDEVVNEYESDLRDMYSSYY